MLTVFNPDKESDIDGTTNRVASFTLESDSLSETPRSFHSKRRKRLPKREKFSGMDVDIKTAKNICINPSECCKFFVLNYFYLLYKKGGYSKKPLRSLNSQWSNF